MGGVARWLKGNWPLTAFALFWLGFVLWGLLDWQESVLFTRPWWIDTERHAVFGLVGFFTLYYYYKAHTMYGSFRIYGQKVLNELVVGKITRWSVYWEGVELFYDFLIQPNFANWFAQAQKGAADTTIDILVAIACARLAALLCRLGNAIYRRLYPIDVEETITDEIILQLEEASNEIHQIRKDNFRKLLPAMKSALKEFFQRLKD